MNSVDIFLVLSIAFGQVLGTTIPGHREEVTNTVRRLLGKHYYPTTAPLLRDNIPASICLAHSALALASNQPWSFRMWDASGKIPDGAAAGATEARGHPELCKGVERHLHGTLESYLRPHRHYLSAFNISLDNIHALALGKRETTIRGKYCLVSLRGSNTNSLGGGSSQLLTSLAGKYQHTYATCIPDSCSAKILQESLYTVQDDDSQAYVICEGEEPEEKVTSSEWSFIMVTVILIFLAGTASLLEKQLPCTQNPASHSCSQGNHHKEADHIHLQKSRDYE
ncbi:hypothetical protein SK128_014983 [Halocaridina rubra]|uniref:Nose resistant-to-fluoxetine protein N-terminal domain-containing protein n=1 Tax=Halocaridina rubra TaxID=373956 RepID=A0AAN8XHA3_HALRR